MKTPISAVYQALHTVATVVGKPVSEVSKSDWRSARQIGTPLPCGLTTAEAFARTAGGWKALRVQAEDAPLHLPVLPDGHRVKGVSTLLDKDGNIAAQWAKTQEDRESREQVLERLLADLPYKIPARQGKIKAPKKCHEDLLAVYPMGDPHLGMLSWAPETGQDFDLKKAVRLMQGAIDNLAGRGDPAEEALVISLGDFFHSDTPDNRTRRSGHHLDVDGRQPKILRAGIDLMIYTIDAALRVHQRVRFIPELGNHDDVSSMFLGIALDLHYGNEPRVTIDTSPMRFHVYEFGKVMLATTHGDGAKPKDMAEIMAAEWPEMWGRTTKRFCHSGHIHHVDKKGLRGATVEAHNTLAPRDAWAAGLGYQSTRDMTRITYHKRWGEEAREIVSADYLEARFHGSD